MVSGFWARPNVRMGNCIKQLVAVLEFKSAFALARRQSELRE